MRNRQANAAMAQSMAAHQHAARVQNVQQAQAQVAAEAQALRATLAWTDRPGSPAAARAAWLGASSSSWRWSLASVASES